MQSSQGEGNVWAVFHRAHSYLGDVAVASARSDDWREWLGAYGQALQHAESCARESRRWDRIAHELHAEMEKRRTREHAS
jgi:hypothetical protein